MVAILDTNGTAVVTYTYDAWGKHLATSGTLAATLGTHNPLRYRGYVYDRETELYYLQSRYYDPEMGRFLNADGFTATGQGLLGNNAFAYCCDNPVLHTDPAGCWPFESWKAAFGFLGTWLFGDKRPLHLTEGSSFVIALKKSKKMQGLIENAIESYKSDGQWYVSDDIEFTAAEDGMNLYLSAQHVEYAIMVTEERRTFRNFWGTYESERYVAYVVVWDTYNFDTHRDEPGFGNTMNNFAYSYSQMGGGYDYDWYATYTYQTQWTSPS